MGSRKLNIAVIFSGEREVGGGFQYQVSAMVEIQRLKNKYNIFNFVLNSQTKKILKNLEIKDIITIKSGMLDKVYAFFTHTEFYYFLAPIKIFKTRFEKQLEKYEIDLVYFLSPSGYSLYLMNHNYIITIWDICHRDLPEFPEVNFYRRFEKRELLYNKVLKKAVAIIVDSLYTKKKLINKYNLDEERIYIVPYQPSLNVFKKKDIDVKAKYKIVGKYIYYPAQFWPHKNHVYIIDAIKILKDKGITITVVFSGSDKGNLKYVLEYAKKRGVADLVRYIGFAPDDEIYSLYKNSLALVMPTYFGPTNIPPLEAFYVGVPVIYSDLPGLKEQVGDAALLCDLKDPNSLAEILQKLINDENLRLELVRRGKERLKALSKVNLADILDKIFEDYAIKRKCWE